MVTLRMQRIGRHKTPHYKIVAIESTRGPKSAKYIEEIGFYNPKQGEISIKTDRAQYWIGVGAQASNTVYNMLVSKEIIAGEKRAVKINKNRKKKK